MVRLIIQMNQLCIKIYLHNWHYLRNKVGGVAVYFGGLTWVASIRPIVFGSGLKLIPAFGPWLQKRTDLPESVTHGSRLLLCVSMPEANHVSHGALLPWTPLSNI